MSAGLHAAGCGSESTPRRAFLLSPADVLTAYDAVSRLYPHVPPLAHWRSWELAAYRHFDLAGRVLDLGCGDGRYFQLLWPRVRDPIGVDRDSRVAEIAAASGVYARVETCEAHRMPFEDGAFEAVFANCSLEHMAHLEGVLREVHRCLRPGGELLCSVVTDRFTQWAVLPRLVELAGHQAAAAALQRQFVEFHHLVNPLSVDGWVAAFTAAGMHAETYVPIMPRVHTSAFLLMDALWHVPTADGSELGEHAHRFLLSCRDFPAGFRKILEGLMDLETDWEDCSGAVFLVRKPVEHG